MDRNSFSKARFTLILWYCAILFFILSAFSIFIYSTETKNFTRVILQRDFGTKVPSSLTANERKVILAQVKALRQTFTFNLIFIDFIVLIIGGGLSYLLAGKTLEPIQETLERQKEFLADASHEFRTPLAAIQTASEVALRTSTRTKDAYKKVIEQTLQESKRLSKMADNLLQLSRIDSGIVSMQSESVNLTEIVINISHEIEPLMKKNSLKFAVSIEKNVHIIGDKNYIKQLLLILLDNAIKYTPPQGKITLSLRSQQRPVLTIADTGVGISFQDQRKIFERFYQVDSARTDKGVGLGLSIAKWIVGEHKATITVESVIEKGSIFTVTFPQSK